MKKKKLILLAVLVCSLFVIGGEHVSAQEQRLNSTTKAFRTFYARFRSAVIRRDKATVSTMTQFPFKYGFDAGDEGTFTKAQFIKRFNNILGKKAWIFGQRNPVFFVVDAKTYGLMDESDASHYIFKKKGTTYKFTAYIVEP